MAVRFGLAVMDVLHGKPDGNILCLFIANLYHKAIMSTHDKEDFQRTYSSHLLFSHNGSRTVFAAFSLDFCTNPITPAVTCLRSQS